MSKEYTLIYFRKDGCPYCIKFDRRNIFPELQKELSTENFKTIIIDSNLPDSVENQKNITRYEEELVLFQNYDPQAPSLCLFYGPVKPLNVFGLLGGSSSEIKFVKIDITKDLSDILNEIKAQKEVISRPNYVNPPSLIHKKKYIKYKYKYLELKNKYLQQKNNNIYK